MDKPTTITKNQFNRYLKVQQSGEYNMFDPNARIVAGLDKNQWLEIMRDYDNLSIKYSEREGI